MGMRAQVFFLFFRRMCHFSIFNWLCTYVQRHVCKNKMDELKWMNGRESGMRSNRQPIRKQNERHSILKRESKLYYIQETENNRSTPRKYARVLHLLGCFPQLLFFCFLLNEREREREGENRSLKTIMNYENDFNGSLNCLFNWQCIIRFVIQSNSATCIQIYYVYLVRRATHCTQVLHVCIFAHSYRTIHTIWKQLGVGFLHLSIYMRTKDRQSNRPIKYPIRPRSQIKWRPKKAEQKRATNWNQNKTVEP